MQTKPSNIIDRWSLVPPCHTAKNYYYSVEYVCQDGDFVWLELSTEENWFVSFNLFFVNGVPGSGYISLDDLSIQDAYKLLLKKPFRENLECILELAEAFCHKLGVESVFE